MRVATQPSLLADNDVLEQVLARHPDLLEDILWDVDPEYEAYIDGLIARYIDAPVPA